MFDYCGVYIGVSTKSSYLFYIDFCLAITRLGKKNAGKIFSQIFFVERTTYSGAFETVAIDLFSMLKKTYSSAFETATIAPIRKGQ